MNICSNRIYHALEYYEGIKTNIAQEEEIRIQQPCIKNELRIKQRHSC